MDPGPVAADDGPVLEQVLAPRAGFTGPVTDHVEADRIARALTAGTGPVALDAERASGYRYSQQAYLVQLNHPAVGTVLLDPIGLGDLQIFDAALADHEWILHAASQDLPCLAEAGMLPRSLFDTELAGRLSGLPKVGLGPLIEHMLGLSLRKGHSSEDWSTRPLPASWLDYAALDVELLPELRDKMEALLVEQGKLEWAHQEFAALVAGASSSPAPRTDPWRRTSGLHAVKDRRALAIVRELWTERDRIATKRDLAPHRVLPDPAIVSAATHRPTTMGALTALPVFRGRSQRRSADIWLAAIARGLALPNTELPPLHVPISGPPAPNRWAAKDPAAHARLMAARTGLAEISERVGTPVENLATPDLVRRVLWEPPDPADICAALVDGGARPWQVDLVTPILIAAVSASTGTKITALH